MCLPDGFNLWFEAEGNAVTRKKTYFEESRMQRFTLLFALVGLCLASGLAQETSTSNPVAVPHLVRFSGLVRDTAAQPLSGTVGVTFALYRDQEGGAPLWLETQNVAADDNGHYTVSLGVTKADGLPVELFTSGEARWLGVQVQGRAEQPRVLLLSVPYALKAADAETLGGMPASAFVLAAPATNGDAGSSSSTTTSTSATANVRPPASSDVTTTGGAVNALPLFTTSTNIQNSIMTQTGTTAVNVAGKLNLPAAGSATATAGRISRPEAFVASSFNHSTSTAVSQTFQLQAEPVANDTANPSGTLNLLYGLGATTPNETGLNQQQGPDYLRRRADVSGHNQGHSDQRRADRSHHGLHRERLSGNQRRLNFDWTVAPTSADTANAIVKRDANGSFNVTNITGTGTFWSMTANTNAITGSTSLDGGKAIVGSATATGGSNRSYGAVGNSFSTVAGSTGVLGQDESTTGAGGFTMGVQGFSSNISNGIGVLGFDGTGVSGVFIKIQNEFGFPAGVWGDGNGGGEYSVSGVVGTTDNGFAGYSKTIVPAVLSVCLSLQITAVLCLLAQ
jgi:hypothetical protein